MIAFVRVNLQMFAQVTSLREVPLADAALMVPHAAVENLMLLERRLVDESFGTAGNLAAIADFLRVDLDVSFEVRGSEERLVADDTEVIALVFVHLDVNVQVTDRLERLGTDLACERFLLAMDATFVHYE